jgi:hypothetical protein
MSIRWQFELSIHQYRKSEHIWKYITSSTQVQYLETSCSKLTRSKICALASPTYPIDLDPAPRALHLFDNNSRQSQFFKGAQNALDCEWQSVPSARMTLPCAWFSHIRIGRCQTEPGPAHREWAAITIASPWGCALSAWTICFQKSPFHGTRSNSDNYVNTLLMWQPALNFAPSIEGDHRCNSDWTTHDSEHHFWTQLCYVPDPDFLHQEGDPPKMRRGRPRFPTKWPCTVGAGRCVAPETAELKRPRIAQGRSE